jgi:hypothetical protein
MASSTVGDSHELISSSILPTVPEIFKVVREVESFESVIVR